MRHLTAFAISAWIACTASAGIQFVGPGTPFSPGAGGPFVVDVDLDSYFATDEGHRVRFDTIKGSFTVDLYTEEEVRTTVDNFLLYVDAGDYDHSIIHRSITGVIQGGGLSLAPEDRDHLLDFIPQRDSIPLEYHFPNVRGTIAMARTSDPDSATSQWFFNTVDNSSAFAPGGVSNDGYAVFGEVSHAWQMNTIDALDALPVYEVESTLTHFPLVDFTALPIERHHLAVIHRVTRVPEYTMVSHTGTSGQGAETAQVEIVGQTLRIAFHPGSAGSAEITVRAQVSDGTTLNGTFTYHQDPAATGYVSGSHEFNAANGIFWSNWFGYYWAGYWPYIYSFDLGWLYAFPLVPESYWIYAFSDQGWFWFSPSVFPSAYRADGDQPGWVSLR